MPKYRTNLPQNSDRVFLSDGGLETILIFHDGFDLPYGEAFTLLDSEKGMRRLRDYYRQYATMAARAGVGFILESPTWRANRDWGARVGYDAAALADINRRAIDLMVEIRQEFETEKTPMVISGQVGPRADAYFPETLMTAEEAQDYHTAQIKVFAGTAADLVTAFTLTNTPEAIGFVRAAQAAHIPAAVSFTVETDGRLPTGLALREAIETVDADTGTGPVYYMINCAHPIHFEGALEAGEEWVKRLRGLRANASKKSHAELDECGVLDAGDPVELGNHYRRLKKRLGHINVVGGCCGTDHRHIDEIGKAYSAAA